MDSTLTRIHDFDDRLLLPAEDVAYPYPRQEVGHERNGPGAWSEYLALRAVQETLGRAPEILSRPLIGGAARLARAFDRERTRIARSFIRSAMPDLSDGEVERLVLSAWKHLLRLTVTVARMHEATHGRRLGDHFDLEVCDGFEELRTGEQGVVFITAHVGNWEALGAPLNALGFNPLYCVGKPPRNNPLALYIQRSRERSGGIMLPRKGAMKGVPVVVRAGGGVVMLLDQRPRQKPIYADFFGRPAACDRSVGVLLRRVGAPLAFVGCYDAGPLRFRLRFSRIIQPQELAGKAPEAVVERVNRELEGLILEAPDQYFWLHDRYRGAPAVGDVSPRSTPGDGPGPLAEPATTP